MARNATRPEKRKNKGKPEVLTVQGLAQKKHAGIYSPLKLALATLLKCTELWGIFRSSLVNKDPGDKL